MCVCASLYFRTKFERMGRNLSIYFLRYDDICAFDDSNNSDRPCCTSRMKIKVFEKKKLVWPVLPAAGASAACYHHHHHQKPISLIAKQTDVFCSVLFRSSFSFFSFLNKGTINDHIYINDGVFTLVTENTNICRWAFFYDGTFFLCFLFSRFIL